MSIHESGFYSAEMQVPASKTLASFNATIEALSYDPEEELRIKALHQEVIDGEPDPRQKEILRATADITEWTLWGQQGDPLPAGLVITPAHAPYPRFASFRPKFPLTRTDYDEAVARLDLHIGKEYSLKPARSSQAQGELDPLQQQLEHDAQSMHFLRELGVTTPQPSEVYDHMEDQRRQTQARAEIQRAYGIDVFAPRRTEEDTSRWLSARAAFGRRAMLEDTPTRTIETEQYNLARTRQKLLSFLSKVDGEAGQIVQEAVESFDLPDYLNNTVSRKATSRLYELLEVSQKQLDGPFPWPTTTKTFLDVCHTLLLGEYSGTYRYGGVPQAHVTAFDTWPEFVNARLIERQKNHNTHLGDAHLGLQAYHDESRATLLAMRQPRLNDTAEHSLATAPVGQPGDARLSSLDYSRDDKNTNITYMSKEHLEALKSTEIASVIVVGDERWPQARRLIRQTLVYDSEEPLPKYDEDADIVMTLTKKGLVDDAHRPHIAGFKIVAEDRRTRRFFFTYDDARDPYNRSADLSQLNRDTLVEAAQSIGMFNLAQEFAAPNQPLTAHQISALVQEYAYQAYPDKDIVPSDRALLANAKTLEDLKKFVTPKGVFCGQCDGGSRLFQLLIDDAAPYDTRTKAIVGHVWDGGSAIISAVMHQQTEIDGVIIDTSLQEGWRHRKLPLRMTKTGTGIALGDSSTELGVAGRAAGIQLEGTGHSMRRRLGSLLTAKAALPRVREVYPTPAHEVSKEPLHREELRSHTAPKAVREQRITENDRTRAEAAKRQLENISAQEVAMVIELGGQALFAQRIDLSAALRRTSGEVRDHEGKTASTALEALNALLPDRKAFHHGDHIARYGDVAQTALRDAARALPEHEASALLRGAAIMQLLTDADIS